MSKNNSNEDFFRTVLDPEDILLNLLSIRKFKRELDEWVKSTNDLLREAARIFRESQISDEKSKFFFILPKHPFL